MEIEYRGYTAKTYGEKGAIIIKDGKILMRTDSRGWREDTEEDLKNMIDIYIKLLDGGINKEE